MKVLIACESSGTVREAFRKLGHDAWSADLLPADDSSPFHVQGDVMNILGEGWDMMIGHPPCTRLCNSGVCWLEKRNLWGDMEKGADFFKALWEAPIELIALENPIPHKYALARIGRRYDQIIQPWMFGHGETKATCLWLKNLPPLLPTLFATERKDRLHRLPPGPDRWKERSKTFQGIADAMAQQWGTLIEQHA